MLARLSLGNIISCHAWPECAYETCIIPMKTADFKVQHLVTVLSARAISQLSTY